MGYAEIISLKNSSKYASTARVDFVTSINTPTLRGSKSYFISARTLYGIFIANMAKAKALLAALQAFDPNLYQMMLVPGDEKGTAGGMDMGLATTQGLVDSLSAAANAAAGTTIITADDVAAIKAFGQVWASESQDAGFATISAAQVDFALDQYQNYLNTSAALQATFSKMAAALDQQTIIAANQGQAVASVPTLDALYAANK